MLISDQSLSMQYTEGIFRIADWADIVTVHTVAGDGTLQALKSTPQTKDSAFLLTCANE